MRSFCATLYNQSCEQKQKVRVIEMLHGFEEISPFYKETVIDLLQTLRQTAVEQPCFTTRPYLVNELEDKLQQLSYTLEPFSEEDQIEFLTKFWIPNVWFNETEEEVKEMVKNKLAVCAEHLIKKLAVSLRDIEENFTGIPLQTCMLAEGFDKDVEIFYESTDSTPKLPFKLDLIEFYGRFIEKNMTTLRRNSYMSR